MATAKSLQKPQIIGITGATIRIAHPDISRYLRAYLRAPILAAGTAATFSDNNGFADDDWFIIGEPGDSTTEEDDVNGAVTRGTAVTITNTLKFGHNINDPITKILERKITLYGSATNGGSLTAIRATGAAVSIQWDKDFTSITLLTTDTAYAYYAVKYYDGTTESEASDYVAATGNGYATVQEMCEKALRASNQKIDLLITPEFLISSAQDCQDEIVQYSYQDTSGNIVRKDWAFEIVNDVTSISALTMENEYSLSSLTYALKYPNSKQAIMNVRLGSKVLTYVSPQDMDLIYQNRKRAELEVATTVGVTSITLIDSSELAADGTVIIGANSITYTANNTSTGVLSGIPASGDGSVDAVYAIGRAVWQGSSGALPERYTIFSNKLILDAPVLSTYANYKFKIKYLKALTRLVEMTDSTEVSFPIAFKPYIAAQILYRKGQDARAEKFMSEFSKILLMNAKGEKTPVLEQYSYYQFTDGDTLNDYPNDDRYYSNYSN